MVEAETVCDRVTLIDRGKIVATESPRTLGRVISRFQRIDVEGVDAAVLDAIAAVAGVSGVTDVDGRRRADRGGRGGRDARRAAGGSSRRARRR